MIGIMVTRCLHNGWFREIVPQLHQRRSDVLKLWLAEKLLLLLQPAETLFLSLSGLIVRLSGTMVMALQGGTGEIVFIDSG